MRIRDLENMVVTRPKGKPLGRVTHVLFHPTELRVVGLEILPPPLFYVIQRRERFVPFDQVERAGEGFATRGKRPVFDSSAEKALGLSWDETVVWQYMPVRTTSDVDLGFARDVEFAAEDGSVHSLFLSDGTTADIAVGTQQVPVEQIEGFDGQYLRVRPSVADQPTSGGVAAAAGRSAAVATFAVKGVAKGAAKAAKAASDSELGKRAAGGWRAFKEAFKEGLNDGGDR